jgi:hypothetical protein
VSFWCFAENVESIGHIDSLAKKIPSAEIGKPASDKMAGATSQRRPAFGESGTSMFVVPTL